MRTESEILEGCRRGDRDAQRALYDRTADRVHRLMLRMTRNADDAADLTQQTYLRAFSCIAQFDGRAALATWLYRIAVTEALQHLRRQRRPATPRTRAELEPATPSALTALEVRLDVEEALHRLDPVDRTMLLLRYDAGEDYRAIAAIVNCAEGTVASRLHRARQRLRALLAPAPRAREETGGGVHPMK